MHFFFSSPLPLVALHRCKSSKTPVIRRVYIPSFIFLTNPPSGGAVQDGVLWGVQLQGIEPRKGIATPITITTDELVLTELQGIEPRKGIATTPPGSRCLP